MFTFCLIQFNKAVFNSFHFKTGVSGSKGLNSISRIHMKKLCMIIPTNNLSAEEVETGWGPQALWTVSLGKSESFRPLGGQVTKMKGEYSHEATTSMVVFWSPHAHMHTHINMPTCAHK